MKLRALLVAAAFFVAWVLPAAAERIVHTVPPNEADPSVTRFLLNSIAIFERPASAPAPMLVFLPGTGADPARLQLFLGVAVDVGYRAIALSYDNEPAVMQACSRQPDPAVCRNLLAMRCNSIYR